MDFKNLISCIHYHEDSQDKDVILETLKTIIDICSIEIHSQMYMSKRSVFEVLQTILKKQSFPTAVQKNALVLISTILYHNTKCQDYFSACDGFLVLKRCFQKYFDTLLLDMKICNGVTGKETYQAINNIIGIISSASLDHGSNKSYVLETENFDAFLKRCLQLGNAELSSACKYLLQVCLMNKGFSPFNSNRYVQVIVLPKKTCVQHGLSSSVELMEVISLEDITQC
ncbi:hypothetical protein HNY73_021975 [Argiope bruennichi]|uniref:Uncharacterized protein n=1 Tax=Argiope bruennichi TaxID=94029 RepID=A0A8T0E322_ARGBR|nr:hypothetical protein HNY73_021975 [Argiope bruennichi]